MVHKKVRAPLVIMHVIKQATAFVARAVTTGARRRRSLGEAKHPQPDLITQTAAGLPQSMTLRVFGAERGFVQTFNTSFASANPGAGLPNSLAVTRANAINWRQRNAG